jgi:hypothetical protein
MNKKLYRVRVVLFVMAQNESEACMAATQARFDIFECTARKAENIIPEWNDAIPFNADDERTCSEILTNTRQAAYSRLQPMKLPRYTAAATGAFDVNNRSSQPGQQL